MPQDGDASGVHGCGHHGGYFQHVGIRLGTVGRIQRLQLCLVKQCCHTRVAENIVFLDPSNALQHAESGDDKGMPVFGCFYQCTHVLVADLFIDKQMDQCIGTGIQCILRFFQVAYVYHGQFVAQVCCLDQRFDSRHVQTVEGMFFTAMFQHDFNEMRAFGNAGIDPGLGFFRFAQRGYVHAIFRTVAAGCSGQRACRDEISLVMVFTFAHFFIHAFH